ncbi:helix-turn-helix transcriptional regulator [Streptomyces pilosus]|uniref:HTH luxR-type domain-containing protein n=1 Tax=Streptomyces pilosus TaxID=28893 RepID=A0A918BKC2_9ACTN|nr:LuxR family transcriptional regulator [Streptomyces pilosus]GGQ73677.1 hypothetical protein GCM10010280_20090 [Streptomyces pilosus]GGV58784.1 hypothetical protein GCM10010261_45540 [Streptomyces pilosus]
MPSASVTEDLTGGEIEKMLLEARRLVESAVDRHRNEGQLLTALEPGEGTETAEQVVDCATRSLVVVLSGRHGEETAPLVAALGRAAARGVDVRLLARLAVLEDRLFLERLDKYAPAVQVRLAGAPLQDMVLADGLVGVMWCRSAGPSAGPAREALVMRAPALLRHLRTLFAASWNGSAPLADHRRLSGRTRSDVARQILLALSSGRTDEVAARELGMSVRTYRRNVAEITRELGAISRFQAGVRAAELGLLPPATAPRPQRDAG